MRNHLWRITGKTGLLVIISLFVGSAGAQWQTNGPTGQKVGCLAINGTTVFAGTEYGGAFLSNDNGGSWTSTNNGLASGVFINSILAVNGSEIFAGTGGTGTGVYISTDNGNSWFQSDSGVQGGVDALTLSGSDLFAGTDAGIFLSTNNGVSWTQVNNGLTTIESTEIEAFAVSGSNIFAGTQGGVYLSSNNGGSWAAMNTGIPAGAGVNSLAIIDGNIFAGVTNYGVYLSTNNGVSWTSVGLANDGILCLATNGSNLFAGCALGLFLSTDNGNTWAEVNTGIPQPPAVASLAISNSTIFAGTIYNNGGVYQQSLSSIMTNTAIHETPLETKEEFSIYPNPTKNNFIVETTITGEKLLQVFDVTGRQILTQSVENSNAFIDAGGLTAGIYTACLRSADGVCTDKLVVTK